MKWLIFLCFVSPALGALIEIRSFQAIPNDGQDDSLQINRAFSQCRTGDRLVFEPGHYDLRQPLVLSNRENLTIDGQHATLVIHGNNLTSVLQIFGCQTVTVENFKITMTPLPYTVGNVMAVHPDAFDLGVPSDSRLSRSEEISRMNCFSADGSPLELQLDLTNTHYALEKQSETILRFFNHQAHRVKTGTQVYLYHQMSGGSAVYLANSHNCLLRNIWIHTFAGNGFLGTHRSSNLTFERCRIQMPPDAGRLNSVTGKALVLAHMGGTALVRDCFFEGMGSRGIQTCGYFGEVTRLLTQANQLEVQCDRLHAGISNEQFVSVGDRLSFFDAQTMQRKGNASVQEQQGSTLLLDTRPTNLAVGDLVQNETMHPEVHITGTTIRNNFDTGIQIQTSQALVENCRLENTSRAGICISLEYRKWFESGPAQDIQIRNNTLIGTHKTQGPGGAISIHHPTLTSTSSPVLDIFQNITIEENYIQNTPGTGIWVNSTTGIKIQNNTLDRCNLNPLNHAGRYGIYLSSCQQGEVTDNQFSACQNEATAKACQEIQGITSFTAPDRTPFEHIIQAEENAIQAGCIVKTGQGATGIGYLAFVPGKPNTYAQWRRINIPDLGFYTAHVRYANGSGANQPCQAILNGSRVGIVSFPPTADWNTWEFETIHLPLRPGLNELTLVTQTRQGGPHLDQIDIKGTIIAH